MRRCPASTFPLPTHWLLARRLRHLGDRLGGSIRLPLHRRAGGLSVIAIPTGLICSSSSRQRLPAVAHDVASIPYQVTPIASFRRVATGPRAPRKSPGLLP